MKFSIKDFFSKCDQIRRKLRIWSHLLKKSFMGNFIFCAVTDYKKKLFKNTDWMKISLFARVFHVILKNLCKKRVKNHFLAISFPLKIPLKDRLQISLLILSEFNKIN